MTTQHSFLLLNPPPPIRILLFPFYSSMQIPFSYVCIMRILQIDIKKVAL